MNVYTSSILQYNKSVWMLFRMWSLCSFSRSFKHIYSHSIYVCYDLIYPPVFLKYHKFLGIFVIFFSWPQKGLEVITAAILHPNLNVDTHNFLFHSYISAYNVLVLKSVRCVYITPTLLCPLFIFCYSLLYLVTIRCYNGLISSLGSLKYRVVLSYKDNRTSHTLLDVL